MTLTVLTDDEIRALLENLTASELEGFRAALARALHEYSSGVPGEPSSVQQPERISVHSAATAATTLFMPSCNSTGNGVKVITLSSPTPPRTPTNTTTTTSPASLPKPATIPPTGAIALFTPAGEARGLVHARTLTAFRTALASLCVVARRPAARLRTLVVFGGGEQAYWHVRLALLARGADVARVVFVGRGRGSDGSAAARRRLEQARAAAGKVEGWAGPEGCEIGFVEPGGEGFEAVLRAADVVFCCTPSTEPLFDAGVWADGGGGQEQEQGRLVVAIGSYTPEMREVPREWVSRVLEGGVVVVDTVDGVLVEAGELIDAGVRREQLVELGSLLAPEGADEPDQGMDGARRGLDRSLRTGNVIYKSVGLGLMDLAVGMHVIQFAQEKGVGTHVQGF